MPPTSGRTFGQSVDLSALLSSLTSVETGADLNGHSVTKLATMFGLVDKEGIGRNEDRGRQEGRRNRENRNRRLRGGGGGGRKNKQHIEDVPTFGSKSLTSLADGSQQQRGDEMNNDENDNDTNLIHDDMNSNGDGDSETQPSVDTFMARRLEHEIRKQKLDDDNDLDDNDGQGPDHIIDDFGLSSKPSPRPRPSTTAFSSALDLFEVELPSPARKPNDTNDDSFLIEDSKGDGSSDHTNDDYGIDSATSMMRPSTVHALNSQISSPSPKQIPQRQQRQQQRHKKLSFSLDTKPETKNPNSPPSPDVIPLPQIFNNVTEDRNSNEFYGDVLSQEISTLYQTLTTRSNYNASPTRRTPSGAVIPNLSSAALDDESRFNFQVSECTFCCCCVTPPHRTHRPICRLLPTLLLRKEVYPLQSRSPRDGAATKIN